MSNIITPPIREIIKVLLIGKYIESSGIKVPEIPQIPEFTLPPKPNLGMLVDSLNDIKGDFLYNGNESIYTEEYIIAYNEYLSRVESAKVRLMNELNDIEDERSKLDEEELRLNKNKFNELEDKANRVYLDEVEKAKKETNINVITKYKRIDNIKKREVNKIVDSELDTTKKSIKNENIEFIKEIAMSYYTKWYNNELTKITRFKNDIKESYDDLVNLFKRVTEEATNYFKGDGDGSKFVDDECDRINDIYENIIESLKEFGLCLKNIVIKIPLTDSIVIGTASSIPNPAQKINIFMEDLRKILSLIKKIKGYINEIIIIANRISLSFDLIPMFRNIKDEFETKCNELDNVFNKSVKEVRKRQKWYAKHEHSEIEDESRLCGYMYADVDVNWVDKDITIKGYKCYCRKDYALKYKENGVTKKSYWLGGYSKNNGSYIDSSGKKYYYLSVDEISATNEYDDNDILESLITDGEDVSLYDIDLGGNYNELTNETTLNLSDGRTITIDYLAAIGDIIQLNDGTIIKVT